MKQFLCLFFCCLVLSAHAFATETPDTTQADTQKIEAYLQDLTTARARFVQTTNDGTQLVGTFYLERPGRLKFEYDAPIDDFVLADGLFIYFYDAELGQQTNAPIGQTLADFFLRKDLKLSGDVRVTDLRRGGGLLQITLAQSADPDAGSLSMAFTEDSETGAIELNKWRVTDAQGMITEVELFYFTPGVTHPSSFFVYRDPNPQPRMLNP